MAYRRVVIGLVMALWACVVAREGAAGTPRAAGEKDEEAREAQPPKRPEEKDKEDEKAKGAERGGPTSIRDALTIDPNLYGVDFSKSILGKGGDVVTREALRESSRSTDEEGLEREKEQIQEDAKAALYAQAMEEARAKAAAREKARAEEAARRRQTLSGETLQWLLLGGGAFVVLAGAAILFAIRKVRAYED